MTDSKDRHSAWLVNRIVRYLVQFTKTCRVIVIPGNHDYLDEAHPFFAFVGRIPGLQWIRKPTMNSMDELFLPHTNDHRRDWSVIDGRFPSHFTTIWTHNTFSGATIAPGITLPEGHGIPLADLPKAKRVFSGDVHIPQQLRHLIYVGPPYTIDFGDDYRPRVLLVDDDIQSIPIPGPQKRLVEFRAEHGVGTGLHELHQGDLLKVRVHLTPDQVPRWAQYRDDVQQWGEKFGYVIVTVQPVVTQRSSKPLLSRVHRAADDQQLLREFAKRRGLDDLTLTAGLNLIKQGEGE